MLQDTLIPDSRKRQALLIGYVEMERIVEEIIVAEFKRIGKLLMDCGYTVEVVVFDTECVIENKLYICGAGLSVKKGSMKNAIVYTGEPHLFQFTLQTKNFASRMTEEKVDYHRLTPNWFHSRVKNFMSTAFRDVDFSKIETLFSDNWYLHEGPFSIKVRNDYGYYNEVAIADTIDKAFRICSDVAEEHFVEEKLIVVDKYGVEMG